MLRTPLIVFLGGTCANVGADITAIGQCPSLLSAELKDRAAQSMAYKLRTLQSFDVEILHSLLGGSSQLVYKWLITMVSKSPK